MTNITTKETDKHVTVDIVGHAGYAEQGKDIVCAGVSTLAYTLINNLDRENCGIKYSIKDGEMHIEFNLVSEKIKNIFETINLGFSMLCGNYPENISIKNLN